MLKRTQEAVRAVAEAAGIINPSVADATKAAEDRRAALIAAQKAVADGEDALDAAHDRGAEAVEVQRLEAALAGSKLNAERAQRACDAAERRLEKAREAEANKGKAEGRTQSLAVLADRQAAAGEVGAALDALRAALAKIDRHDARLAELAAKGHVTRNAQFGVTYGPGASRAQIKVAVADILNDAPVPSVKPFAEFAAVTLDLQERAA